jgi:hypothetical protein
VCGGELLVDGMEGGEERRGERRGKFVVRFLVQSDNDLG